MSKLVPTPTPHHIEAALFAMRDGTSIYGRWVRLENLEQINIEAKGLWWVTAVDPDNVEQGCPGGGGTSVEAAAVAWINACLCAWWMEGPLLSVDHYAKVPRCVPVGWQFELHDAPGALTTKIH